MFILTKEENDSYRLVNLDQAVKVEVHDVKRAGEAYCVLHMSDKSDIRLREGEMNLALDAMHASPGIQGYDRSTHRPR